MLQAAKSNSEYSYSCDCIGSSNSNSNSDVTGRVNRASQALLTLLLSLYFSRLYSTLPPPFSPLCFTLLSLLFPLFFPVLPLPARSETALACSHNPRARIALGPKSEVYVSIWNDMLRYVMICCVLCCVVLHCTVTLLIAE
jgi:hypothetical protein